MSVNENVNNIFLYQLKTLIKDDTDIGQIILNIQNHIKDKDVFKYDPSILEKKNFIITPKFNRKN